MACIVWFDTTLLKVYEALPRTLTLSTNRYAILRPGFGVIVYVMLEPDATEVLPGGDIEPPLLAEAEIV